jgi:Phosphotransferase enzyme family
MAAATAQVPVSPSAVRDDALPELPRLLDADAMAEVLDRSLGTPGRVSGARGRYLRYKPGTNLRVLYEVTVGERRHEAVVMIAAEADLARRAVKPANRAMARMVARRSPARDPLVYDAELDALVQWLPLDLALRGLVEAPDDLRRHLREAGLRVGASGPEPHRLAYKPHRRAALLLDDHVVKAYATERRFRAAEARLRGVSSSLAVRTAPFEAAVPALRVTVQPYLPGRKPDSAYAAARTAGRVLRALHASPVEGLERLPPARQHAVAAQFGEMVTAIAPHLGPRVKRLVERLHATLPDAAEVPSHGDFHEGQLLFDGDAVAVIDLDEMTAAPRALDIATYAAHSLWGDEGQLEDARAMLERLVEGYGERPPGLDWYLSALILRRASHPFRRMLPDWPERVAAMVGAAEEAL